MVKWGIAILIALTIWSDSAASGEDASWIVYYSDKAHVSEFKNYDLLVFDSHEHPVLQPLASRGKIILGYLSLGEVERHRPYFQRVRAKGLLIRENPNWKDSWMVDLRDPRWTSWVIEELVPDILRQGFHGLFLDTLDNAQFLKEQDPQRFAGMTAAAARLVRTIRQHYPRIIIMMNRAYEILPQVEKVIDIVLGESVYADYDFSTKTYKRVPEAIYLRQVEALNAAKTRRPDLRVLTLDYWNPQDLDGMAVIYRAQRANGFEPYVSTIELDRIVPEPGK